MENKRLIKIDKNGSKHYEVQCTCDRCQGRGWYAVGVLNGQLVPSHMNGAVCYKCGGSGISTRKEIERTPEYQAKLDAKRQKRMAEKEAKWEAEREAKQREWEEKQREWEEKEREREERIKAEKSISQYVGRIGERIFTEATYIRTISFDVPSFRGYGVNNMNIHIFKDNEGNTLIWKSAAYIDADEGETVELAGTVKEHREYKDEKQTSLSRCKIRRKNQ